MSRYLLLLLNILLSGMSWAQLGPTGGRDTSFSIAGSFTRELKYHPEIQLARPGLPANVRKTAAQTYTRTPEGRTLQLEVFQPTSRKLRPAILMIHGGGWRSGDRSHNYTLAGQLAARGYVAITADYRLSTEALYPAAVHDLKAALRWIRRNAESYAIDPRKIAVLGFSAGGQLAALIGTTNGNAAFDASGASDSSSVQAIIDLDGILAFIHPESGEGDDSKSTSAATYWFGYSKTEKPELWKQGSALTHVGAATPPTLFVNSSVARMHAGRDDFIAVLNQYGIYSEVHTFENAPHTFLFFEPWFTPTLAYIDGFLRRVFSSSN